MIGRIRWRWALAMASGAILLTRDAAHAQAGGGEGFLFREAGSSLTLFGGVQVPSGGGDLFRYVTEEFLVRRSAFRAPTVGFDLAFAAGPRMEILFGMSSASSRVASEYRDFIDADDRPVTQTTAFARVPYTVAARYYLADRGRSIGTTAWVPARVVPFVGAGVGTMRYRFEQVGDFIQFPKDSRDCRINVCPISPDRLTASGWTPVLQGSGGVQLNLSPRVLLTTELRYLRGSADASRPERDFVGYRLDLSGLTTLVGLTLRL